MDAGSRVYMTRRRVTLSKSHRCGATHGRIFVLTVNIPLACGKKNARGRPTYCNLPQSSRVVSIGTCT